MQKVYITTAIAYANGVPHLGHAYEILIADTINRMMILGNKETFFQTGSDEHGLKIQQSAIKRNITPQQLCDENVSKFKDLYTKLGIEYSHFTRTSSEQHKKKVLEIFEKISEKGLIYKGVYSGYYNVREERYLSEIEARLTDYKDPVTNQEYSVVEEESYFFKMEPFRRDIINYLSKQDVLPTESKHIILERLKSPLHDLSISRTSFDWGIPIGGGHVLYVWFDALLNYYNESLLNNCFHIIGKDIVWFHAVIWIAMLLALESPLPKKIIVHGFINDKNGLKMSKSIGNVISPDILFERFPADVIRYHFIKHFNGSDFKFDLDKVMEVELPHLFGNYICRCFKMLAKYNNSVVPSCSHLNSKIIDNVVVSYKEQIANLDIKKVLEIIQNFLVVINKNITEDEPWKLCPGTQRDSIVAGCTKNVFVLAYLYEPYLPETCKKLKKSFSLTTNISDLNNVDLTDSQVNTDIGILFPTQKTINSL